MKIFIPLLVILFLGCSIEDSRRTDNEIKADLFQLVELIPVIEAGLSLTDENSTINGSFVNRAITPGGVSSGSDILMSKYFGSNWNSKDSNGVWLTWSPRVVFENSAIQSEIVSGVLRIPNSGNINGLYNDSTIDFYMELEELTASEKYKVSLYIYPRSDFNTDYIVEEYVVYESSISGEWGWSTFDNTGQLNKLISDTTYYRDGSNKKRETLWNSNLDGGNIRVNEIYNDAPSLTFSVTDLISDYSDYEYFLSEPIYTFSSVTDFYSSKSSGRIRGNRTFKDILEYYTEESGSKSWNVQFIEATKRWDTSKEVNRSYVDRSTGESNFISLITSGGEWNQTSEIIHIKQTETTYYSETHSWFKGIDSVTGVNDADSIILELTKNGSLYEGTSTKYWGSSGEIYNYSINSATGEIVTSWQSSTSRNLSNQTIDLSDLTNITISVGDWSFNGEYQLREFTGTYSYKGDTTNVSFDQLGLDFGNEKIKW